MRLSINIPRLLVVFIIILSLGRLFGRRAALAWRGSLTRRSRLGRTRVVASVSVQSRDVTRPAQLLNVLARCKRRKLLSAKVVLGWGAILYEESFAVVLDSIVSVVITHFIEALCRLCDDCLSALDLV